MNIVKRSTAVTLAVLVCLAFLPFFAGTDGMAQAATKPAKVKITKATKTNQMVVMKWKTAKGAKKYQVYMKKGSSKWKKIKTTKAKTFRKNGLAWNTKYKFKVRAINGKKTGAFSTIYQGKIRKKTTVQKVLTAAQKQQLDQEGKAMADAVNEAAGGPLMESGAAAVSGNTIILTLTFAMPGSAVSAADSQKIKADLDKQFTGAATKKAMHEAIVKDQNSIGIVGITYKVVFRYSDGTNLVTYSYK